MDDTLAQDLVAMWQSELTAMAADRELRESWAALVALWSHMATAALAYLPRDPAGGTGSAQPPRPPAPAAAPHAGLDEVEQLKSRVAELEQRLAGIVAGPAGARRPRRPAGDV